MKKFTTLILAFICISAFYALNLSTNCFAAAPNSFKVSDLDYVSFFVSFNFQAVEILASDYIMNLARSYEKDEKNLQLSYLSALFNPVKRTFYDDETKNLLFQKMLFTKYNLSFFKTKRYNL